MPLTRTVKNVTQLALAAAVLSLGSLVHATELDAQRALFKRAHAAAERGDWSVAVSYTHLTLPTNTVTWRGLWSGGEGK